VWSTFLKLFAHVLLVVQGKILQLKFQKQNIFFVWASRARNGRFEHYCEENDHRPLRVKSKLHSFNRDKMEPFS
jgi:hypothetical protein